MDITFYNISSENNALNKTLSNGLTLSGTLRAQTSIVNPVIRVEGAASIVAYNYCHIPAFNRYYFINDCVSIRSGLWEISMHVDVLMSFRAGILSSPVVLDSSEDTGKNAYLDGDVWTRLVKTKTDIINFPSGLSESGHYILITAGG